MARVGERGLAVTTFVEITGSTLTPDLDTFGKYFGLKVVSWRGEVFGGDLERTRATGGIREGSGERTGDSNDGEEGVRAGG